MKKKILTVILFFAFGVCYAQVTSFKAYLNYFQTITLGSITSECFKTKPWNIDKYLNKSIVQTYIVSKNDCECEKMELRFYPGKKINLGKFVVAFVYKDCDVASKGNFPYNENLIVVYSLTGEIIDSKVISKYGDFWCYTLNGSVHPFEITVEQATVINCKDSNQSKKMCEAVKIKYSINQDGKIVQKLISKRNAKMFWDDSINNFRIEPND